MSQDVFVKTIQKDKYVLLTAISKFECSTPSGDIDSAKLKSIKEYVNDYNEKSVSRDLTITNILLIYPGTDCESKRANMMKLVNHIRFPKSKIIIITPTKLTTGVVKGLQSLSDTKEHKYHMFKTFTYNLLTSIIPKYELAPSYHILTDEEKNKLTEYFIDINNLPKIFEDDPQMIWIGAEAGQIIKYTYLSEVTIEAVGYCIVVSGP
jgi:DNA-directed RNA polymerase subunit H (RpoH/RPB5)